MQVKHATVSLIAGAAGEVRIANTGVEVFRIMAGLFGTIVHRFSGFFRKPKRTELATLANGLDRTAFVQALGNSEIWLFAGMDCEGLDPENLTEEALNAEIERVTRELSELDYIEPFVYIRDGRRHLPIFTNLESAESFCGEFSRQQNKVYPFKTLEVNGTTLCSLFCLCDVVVLNDSVNGEYQLTSDDVSLFRQTWSLRSAVA